MADDFSIDFSELDKLTVDLGEASKGIGEPLRQAHEVSDRNIKDSWAEKLRGEPHLPHAPSSITYELIATPGQDVSTLRSDIGAQKGRRQAPIVVVIESGSPNTAPRGYGAGALHEEQAGFEQGVTKALDTALRKAGL